MFSLHEYKYLFDHFNILQLQIWWLTEESNFFVLLSFKRVFLQYKTSEIQYFYTPPEMFE